MRMAPLWIWLGVFVGGILLALSPLAIAFLLSAAGGFEVSMWDENGPGVAIWYMFYTIPLGVMVSLAGFIGFLVTGITMATRR